MSEEQKRIQELENKVKILEGLVIGGGRVARSNAEWRFEDPHNRILAYRIKKGSSYGHLIEDNMAIGWEKPFSRDSGKHRLVCWMSRGITLYAEYLPIYEDAIKMLKQMRKKYGVEIDVTNHIQENEAKLLKEMG